MIEENTVVKSVGEMIKEGSLNPRDIHSEWEKKKDVLIMTCTLHEDIKPAAPKTDSLTPEKVRKVNEDVLSVWDVKAKGWRSFRWGLISEVNETSDIVEIEALV